MPNINKVVYGGTTLIDLTDSTLSSTDQLMQGVTAYDRSGTKITGTATGGGITGSPYWMWRDTSGVVRISATDPSEEPTYAESIVLFTPPVGVVGTAIVGQSITAPVGVVGAAVVGQSVVL